MWTVVVEDVGDGFDGGSILPHGPGPGFSEGVCGALFDATLSDELAEQVLDAARLQACFGAVSQEEGTIGVS